MAASDVSDVIHSGIGTAPVTGVLRHARAVRAEDLGAALADEIGRLDEEGRRLQVLASRMAQDTRPKFEAWFEAGLLLRRASTRLDEVVRRFYLT